MVGMSVLCQDRTWALLFNYFVGARKHCGRNFEVERLGGLEIDDQFEPGRLLLDRQVGRFGAFENLVNEVSRAAIQAEQVYAVTNQTPGLRIFPGPDRGELIGGCQSCNRSKAWGEFPVLG